MKRFLYNRFVIYLLLPLALYYAIYSVYLYYVEHKALKKVIIKNESFFKALMTLNFKGHKYLPSVFYTIMPVDEKLSEAEIQDIAQKQIVSVVLKYAKNENILSKINVTTILEGDDVVFELKPAHCELAVSNAVNLIISTLISTVLYFIIMSFI